MNLVLFTLRLWYEHFMSKRSGRQAKQFYSSLRGLLHPDIFPYKQTQILWALCTLIGQLGLKPMFYKVINPFSWRLVHWRMIPRLKDWRPKNEQWAEKRSFEASVKFWGQSTSPIYQQDRKGFICFITLHKHNRTCELISHFTLSSALPLRCPINYHYRIIIYIQFR